MRQIFGFETKPLRNLSASRIDLFNTCVAKLFYESLLSAPSMGVHPASLLGNILHYICEMMLKKMLKEGPLSLRYKDETVEQWTKFIWAVFLGTEVLPNRKPQSINWLMPYEIEKIGANNTVGLEKEISAKMRIYAAKGRWAIEAFYYLCSKGIKAVRLETEKEFRLHIPSTVEFGINILIIAYLDVLAFLPNGSLTVIDWKTGKRSNMTDDKLRDHKQMLIYAHAVYQKYGVVPATLIVSLEVYPSDLNKPTEQLQSMLMKEPFMTRVPVNYESQISDFIQMASEIWYVLRTIIEPPHYLESQSMATKWLPKSHLGNLLKYERHILEQRPIPNVGCSTCSFCSARSKCELDNKSDWDKLRKSVADSGLSLLADIDEKELSHDIAVVIPPVPEGTQYNLFAGMPQSNLQKIAVKKLVTFNWRAIGFCKINSKSSKEEKKIWKLLPRHWSGTICQCISAGMLWERLISLYPLVVQEEIEFKNKQRQERKDDLNKSGMKIQPLRESKWINAALLFCPVEECEHKCHPKSNNQSEIDSDDAIDQAVLSSHLEAI